MDTSYPQNLPWRLWTPASKLFSTLSFPTVAQDITKGLSASRATAADGHWMTWSEFCQNVALDTLLISYMDPVPILNTFVRQYRTESLAPSGHQIQSRTVEYAVRLVRQALTAMGDPDPCLTSKGELNIRLQFQYWCYSK